MYLLSHTNTFQYSVVNNHFQKYNTHKYKATINIYDI